MKVLILIPTYNSEKKILDVLTDIKINATNADVLVIDHGSTDRTKYLLYNNDVNHLIMPLETTYYQALSLGMIFAKNNHYDVVVEWDDKGKFKAEDIKYFAAAASKGKFDFVLGSRFLESKAPKTLRWSGTRTLKRTIRMSAGAKLTDPSLRFRAYGKKAISAFAHYDNYGPAPDTIAKFIKDGLTYTESPTSLNDGFKKQLHLGFKHSIAEIFRWTMWIIFVLPFRKNMLKKKRGKNE